MKVKLEAKAPQNLRKICDLRVGQLACRPGMDEYFIGAKDGFFSLTTGDFHVKQATCITGDCHHVALYPMPAGTRWTIESEV